MAGAVTSSSLAGMGTLRWQAPELMDKDPTKTRKSDVYAFAMTTYEVRTPPLLLVTSLTSFQILSGKVPYDQYALPGPIVQAIFIKGERPEKEPMYSAAGDSYEQEWAIAEECWATDPSSRPTMKQISTSLLASPCDHQDTSDPPTQTDSKDVLQGSMKRGRSSTHHSTSPSPQHIALVPDVSSPLISPTPQALRPSSLSVIKTKSRSRSPTTCERRSRSPSRTRRRNSRSRSPPWHTRSHQRYPPRPPKHRWTPSSAPPALSPLTLSHPDSSKYRDRVSGTHGLLPTTHDPPSRTYRSSGSRRSPSSQADHGRGIPPPQTRRRPPSPPPSQQHHSLKRQYPRISSPTPDTVTSPSKRPRRSHSQDHEHSHNQTLSYRSQGRSPMHHTPVTLRPTPHALASPSYYSAPSRKRKRARN